MLMDDRDKTRLKAEMEAWIARVSGGLTSKEKPSISDTAGIFISQNKYRIASFRAVLKQRKMEIKCGWKKCDFKALEDKVKELEEENKYLRTLKGR